MFVSLQFKLELRKEDKEKLTQLMRKQSSAIRVAYNMLRGLEKEKTKNLHAQIYQRLRQLFPDIPTKYIDSAIYKAKQYPTDKPVVLGSRKLFEKLCKNHLTGKAKERLKKQWIELRQGTLVSMKTNQYKRNALESEAKTVENAKELLTNLIQSLQSESSGCEGAYGRNPEQGETKKVSQVAWQVLRVALLFPILGKVLPRDLSPLKPILVEGVWDRVRSRLVPLEAGGTVPIRDF